MLHSPARYFSGLNPNVYPAPRLVLVDAVVEFTSADLLLKLGEIARDVLFGHEREIDKREPGCVPDVAPVVNRQKGHAGGRMGAVAGSGQKCRLWRMCGQGKIFDSRALFPTPIKAATRAAADRIASSLTAIVPNTPANNHLRREPRSLARRESEISAEAARTP